MMFHKVSNLLWSVRLRNIGIAGTPLKGIDPNVWMFEEASAKKAIQSVM